MTTTTKLVTQWYLTNIPKPVELDAKITATLEYIKRFNEPDAEGDWVVFAYELISGAHGQYTVRLFLNEVVNDNHTSLDHTDYTELEDLDEVMQTFDEVGTELARVFTKHSKLPGAFHIGHNEADGSLGVFYSVRA